MSKDPAFLFYPGDWLGGTLGMTLEEKGAYFELLMLQFNRGHMTSHMIGHTIGHLWDNIKDKFILDETGLYYNKRLEEEKIKRQKYTTSRKNNKEGKNQHTKSEGHMTSHMTFHMENENENENVIKNKDKDRKEEFEIFYENYGKHERNNKKTAFLKWKVLIKEKKLPELNFLLQKVDEYKNSLNPADNDQFKAGIQVWLNKERWNDDFPPFEKNKKEHIEDGINALYNAYEVHRKQKLALGANNG